MTTKKVLIGFIGSMMVLAAIYIFSLPITKASDDIPEEYSDEIDLDDMSTYIYNVTGYGDFPAEWYGFDWSKKGDWETNPGGQVEINFTGFYERDPNDLWGDDFPDSNMPWYSVKIFKKTSSGLKLNFTANNVSNAEAQMQMALGYMGFASGFLIPIENMPWIKAMAYAQDTSFVPTRVQVEETYNLIYFGFEQVGGFEQKTHLTYDKKTGLLLWANTTAGNYKLELFLTNRTLDLDTSYNYNIKAFGEDPVKWYGFNWVKKGDWLTNPGGKVVVKFTGYFDRDPNDFWGDDFPDTGMPWLSIEILKSESGKLVSNFTQTNISNAEVRLQMRLGYVGFASGFLIPWITNEAYVKETALAQDRIFNPTDVSIEETNLTIEFRFKQICWFEKEVYLLYEKWSGLLLWADSTACNYHLLLELESQSGGDDSNNGANNGDDSDNGAGERDNSNNENEADEIAEEEINPILIVAVIVGASSGFVVLGYIISKSRRLVKLKKK